MNFKKDIIALYEINYVLIMKEPQIPPSVHEPIIGLPDFKIISYQGCKTVEIEVEYIGRGQCPHCFSQRLRKKDSFQRFIKHHSIGLNKSVLILKTFKFQCYDCKRYFNQRFQEINPYQRSTEPFKEQVGLRHHHGTNKRVTAADLGVGEATVERYYHRYLTLQSNETCSQSRTPNEEFKMESASKFKYLLRGKNSLLKRAVIQIRVRRTLKQISKKWMSH